MTHIRRGGIAYLILLVAQQARHAGRLIEGSLGVEGGPQRAVVNLLEVRLAGFQERRRNIKRDRPWAQPKRVQAGVGAVNSPLEIKPRAGQLVELRHRRAVDDLHAAMVRIGIFVRQQGVG